MATLDDFLYTYFISGANDPGDMLGLVDCGLDWGCAVNELRPKWELGVQYTLDTDLLSFWDSGAVSEWNFKKKPPKRRYVITDEDWRIRLSVYLWVAERLGPQAHLVAPDEVMSQGATLKRLARYADTMRECYERGANIVVPHQGGQLSLELFTGAAADILGFDDFIVGFPMREISGTTQMITPLPAVVSYCDVMQPQRIHLLGIGPRKRHHPQFAEVLEPIVAVAPETDIFADSAALVGMRGLTGSAKSKKRTPRPLKVAEERAIELLRERLHGRAQESIRYEESLDDPRHYVGYVRWRLLVEGWADAGIIPEDAVDYGLEDPPGLLARGRLFENPQVREELDTEWRLVTNSTAAQIWKRREGIRRVLCPEAYEAMYTEAVTREPITGPPAPKRRR
jgi:hypothetical protein